MSSVAFDIAARLATLNHGTVGTDIFVEDLPDGELAGGSPDDSLVGVFALPSGIPTEESMGDTVDFELWLVQIQIRENDIETAQDKAYEIYNDLPTSGSEITINLTGYNRIWRASAPRKIQGRDAAIQFTGEDSQGRVKWVLEFGVKRRPEGIVA